jgi:hypothetical protein
VKAGETVVDLGSGSGPAFYLGAEDDVDELHIHLAAIIKHFGTTFADVIANGLYVLPLLGQDAVLCTASRSGKVETRALYRQIYEAAGDIKPKKYIHRPADTRLRRQ